MSEKELIYIDDTMSHIDQIDNFLSIYIDDVEDEKLVKVLEKVLKEDQKLHDDFLQLFKK